MTKAGTSAFGAMLVAGSVITAPAQRYPGQPTDAKVWIQNRAKTEAIPISDAARKMTDGTSPLEHALGDGEDFELAFAVSPDDGERLLREERRLHVVTAEHARGGVGLGEPGLHGVHAHLESAELVGRHPHQLVDGRFARGVTREVLAGEDRGGR